MGEIMKGVIGESKQQSEEGYGKSKIIAILLALSLGKYGVHHFYLGKPALGLLYFIFSKYEIIFYLSLCDVLFIIFTNNEVWTKKYGIKKFPKKKN
ncbi:MAG: TM2 domain-containing protein [Bacilli bacterium]|nr:TM2 domain-containing protein [Bacilli bacterium]